MGEQPASTVQMLPSLVCGEWEIYDPYGDLLYTLDEPTQRPESGESLLFNLNKAQQVQRPYSFITIAYQPEGNFSDYVLTLEEPIASVVIGTNRTTE